MKRKQSSNWTAYYNTAMAAYQAGRGAKPFVKKAMALGRAGKASRRLTAAGNVLTTKYTPAASIKFKARKKLSKKSVKFYKKVKEIVQDEIGTCHLVRANTPFDITWNAWVAGATTGQAMNAVTLAPLGGDVTFHNDLQRMFDTIAIPAHRPESWVNICHGTLDLVIGNYQAVETAVTADVDIYECVCIKDVPTSIATNPGNQLRDSMIEMDDQYAGANVFNLSVTALGNTPFQAYTFCKYWKITGKKKVFVAPGDSTHVEYKQTYNDRKIFGEETTKLLAKAGTTKCYVIMANNVDRSQGEITVYVNKRYSYKSPFIKTPQGTNDNTL